jgi:LruC domain-containing protein
VEPVTLTINILFAQDKYSYSTLDISNFNPFLIVSQTRGIEVHLPYYAPTDLVDTNLFGTLHDDSNPTTGRYYVTSSNLPWGINIYESFDYPIEKQEILGAYPHFVGWAESSGALYSDWYKDLPGYRNSSVIYQVPVKK